MFLELAFKECGARVKDIWVGDHSKGGYCECGHSRCLLMVGKEAHSGLTLEGQGSA